MIAHISAGSSGRSAPGGVPPRSVVEVSRVEEVVVVVEAEDTAELPRAARAVSSEVMFIATLDPSWDSKVEGEVDTKEVVVVGAVMVGGRGQEARACNLCRSFRWTIAHTTTQRL